MRSLAQERGLGVVQWITAHDNCRRRSSVYDSVGDRTAWVTYEIDLVAKGA